MCDQFLGGQLYIIYYNNEMNVLRMAYSSTTINNQRKIIL